jgi:hypothetical protein
MKSPIGIVLSLFLFAASASAGPTVCVLRAKGEFECWAKNLSGVAVDVHPNSPLVKFTAAPYEAIFPWPTSTYRVAQETRSTWYRVLDGRAWLPRLVETYFSVWIKNCQTEQGTPRPCNQVLTVQPVN